MSAPFSKKRNDFGQKAVDKICEMLDVRRIEYQLSTEFWGKEWTPYKDLVYGDVSIFNNWFDIKRNSVSVESLEKFEGTGFLMFNYDMDKNIFIPRTLSRVILERVIPVELDSRDLGFRFGQFENHNFVSIEHFLDNILIKYDNTKKTIPQIS
jgi:hypothetical protein